jgi:uncharacterized protein (DUF302 family)
VLVKQSRIDYEQTLSALLAAIERRGLTVLAHIDHAAGARAAGLELDAEDVVLFGNPHSGTPLMQSDRRIGIELPLRVLLWREDGQVMLGYRDPRELGAVYDVGEHRDVLEQMAALLGQLAQDATG